MEQKLKLSDFSFNIDPLRIDKDSWKAYYDVRNKKDLTEDDKQLIKLIREEIKKETYGIRGLHKKTNVDKTWEKETNKISRKELCLELVAEIRKKRNELNVVKKTKKTFLGAHYSLVGGVFEMPKQILVVGQNTTINNPRMPKTPYLKKNYIGIELEFNDNHTQSEDDIADRFKKENLGRYVDVGRDGSCGFEVRVLVPEDNFIEPLTKILAILNDMGFATDSRCGTHVHLDMRQRNIKSVYENFFMTQTFLRKLITRSRKSNTYCKRNTKAKYEDQINTNDRYLGINTQSYNRHSTLEIRMHHGTLKASELIPWIKFLVKVASYSDTVSKRILTLKQASVEFKLEPELTNVLKDRLGSLLSKIVTAS